MQTVQLSICAVNSAEQFIDSHSFYSICSYLILLVVLFRAVAIDQEESISKPAKVKAASWCNLPTLYIYYCTSFFHAEQITVCRHHKLQGQTNYSREQRLYCYSGCSCYYCFRSHWDQPGKISFVISAGQMIVISPYINPPT